MSDVTLNGGTKSAMRKLVAEVDDAAGIVPTGPDAYAPELQRIPALTGHSITFVFEAAAKHFDQVAVEIENLAADEAKHARDMASWLRERGAEEAEGARDLCAKVTAAHSGLETILKQLHGLMPIAADPKTAGA